MDSWNKPDIFIENWLRTFPREQLHFLRLEDYSEYRQTEMDKLFEFLDLKPIPITVYTHKNQRRPKFSALGDMLPETRRILDNFFLPFNVALTELLWDKRFLWN